MLYLKLCVNAIPAGIYAAACVAGLVLLLNMGLAAPPLWPGAALRVLATTACVYIPLTAVALPLLLLSVRFFAVRRLTMTWVHPKSIVWFAITAMGMVTGICHVNLRFYDDLIPPAARDALKLTAALMVSCWVGAVIAAALAQVPRRAARWRPVAALFVIVPAAAMLVVAAGAAPPAPVSELAATSTVVPEREISSGPVRLLIVELEGASMDQILPMVTAGRLPVLARMLREGASARLNTIRFGPDGVDRAALLSGMPAWRQDLNPGGAIRLRLGAGIDLQQAPRGFFFVPLAARQIPASKISPRPASLAALCRWLGLESAWVAPRPAGVREAAAPAVPPRVLRRVMENPPRPGDATGEFLERILASSISRDQEATAIALQSLAALPAGRPGMLGVSMPGLAAVAAYFLRYHLPEEFGNVPREEIAAYGPVLGRYYEFLDEQISTLMRAAGDETVVMVVSAHGVEPSSLAERLGWRLERRSGAGTEAVAPSGSWWHGPDGVLLLRGSGIAAGERQEDADLQDLVPTALYMLGLPLGRDMRGRILRKAFDPGFLERHQVLFIPSYPSAS